MRRIRAFVPRLLRLPLHLTVILVSVVWLLPSTGLFISSLRPRHKIHESGWWEAFKTPFEFTLDNYSHVISRNNMGRSFANSLFIALPSTIIPIILAAFAAYALTRMDFKGRKLIFTVIVGLIVVPLQMTLIPMLKIFNRLGLTGSFLGIWLAHSAYGLPFAVYLLRNSFQQIHEEIFESARMDGAGHREIFFHLVLPLSVPALASIGIFQFMWVWNDLLVALIFLGGTPDVAPMTVTISHLVSSQGSGWEYLTAAAFISMILPMIVFFSLQKYFVKGILDGAVKQ